MQRVIEADIRAYCPALEDRIPTKIPEAPESENFIATIKPNGQSDSQSLIICPLGRQIVTFSVNITTGKSVLECNGCPKNPEGVSQEIIGVE